MLGDVFAPMHQNGQNLRFGVGISWLQVEVSALIGAKTKVKQRSK